MNNTFLLAPVKNCSEASKYFLQTRNRVTEFANLGVKIIMESAGSGSYLYILRATETYVDKR